MLQTEYTLDVFDIELQEGWNTIIQDDEAGADGVAEYISGIPDTSKYKWVFFYNWN